MLTKSDWHPLSFIRRIFPECSHASFRENEAEPVCIQNLGWDSEFFKFRMLKLEFLSECVDADSLLAHPALQHSEPTHIIAEVPARASGAIQTLGKAGFCLTETRLNYFHTLKNLPPEIRKSRMAVAGDSTFLKKTASLAVNPSDRYHTDPFFSPEMASRYLETYINNCLNGHAEAVLVPDLETAPASFAAFSELRLPFVSESSRLYRIPLTACLPENQGWHYHLCLSALHKASENHALALIMTTQAANGAVIHNCEKLGFRLGSVFHVYSRIV
jgi:dTDP-4-amino-4,6-dideoxy-D-galactose acyltransferase